MHEVAAAKERACLRLLRKLYRASFPRNERMPFRKLVKGAGAEMTEFTAYFLDGVLIGFTYTVRDGSLAYLFYFAVERRFRSRGLGSQILKQLKARYNVPLLLDIEATGSGGSDKALRLRRKAFYLRNGFSEAGFGASYRGVEYETLCCGGRAEKEGLKRLFTRFRQEALGERVKH